MGRGGGGGKGFVNPSHSVGVARDTKSCGAGTRATGLHGDTKGTKVLNESTQPHGTDRWSKGLWC